MPNPTGRRSSRRNHRLDSGTATIQRRKETPGAIARELKQVVYYIRTEDDLIKIGYTANLNNRRRSFGPGWQRVLAVTPGTFDDEQQLHSQFGQHRARGAEYYHPAAELVEHINQIRRRCGVPPVECW